MVGHSFAIKHHCLATQNTKELGLELDENKRRHTNLNIILLLLLKINSNETYKVTKIFLLKYELQMTLQYKK